MGDIIIGTGARQSSVKRIFHEFRREPISSKRLGGAATGTAGDRNNIWCPGAGFQEPGCGLEGHVKGTQTILAPALGTNGLAITQDVTDNDGYEWTLGITARSPFAFVVGTDKAFGFEVKCRFADVSGVDPFLIGFRKAEAYQADHNDYDEMAGIGIAVTDIKTQTILNNAATVVTDTTQDAADDTEITFKTKVSAAGVVTYEVNGAAPTTVVAYTFDNGEIVVPFMYFLHGTTSPGVAEVVSIDCGYL